MVLWREGIEWVRLAMGSGEKDVFVEVVEVWAQVLCDGGQVSAA